MPKSKEQIDSEIHYSATWQEADVEEEPISTVPVRHSSSVHPLDCSCAICQPLRFKGVTKEEDEIKEVLEWDTN